MMRVMAGTAFACAIATLGCGAKKPPVFPAVMVPKAGVGSIVTPWTSPAKTTWLCATKADVSPSSVAMTGTSTHAATIASDISLSISTWMSAGGKYEDVEDVTVTLNGGSLESAPLADLVVRFERLPEGCQDAIRMQEEGGAKFFAITTKVYRGDITAKVKISSSASVRAKSEAIKRLQADLGGTASTTSSSDVFVSVQGGVWIIESEPYTVPGPSEQGSVSPPQPRVTEDVALLRKDVAQLRKEVDELARPKAPLLDSSEAPPP